MSPLFAPTSPTVFPPIGFASRPIATVGRRRGSCTSKKGAGNGVFSFPKSMPGRVPPFLLRFSIGRRFVYVGIGWSLRGSNCISREDVKTLKTRNTIPILASWDRLKESPESRIAQTARMSIVSPDSPIPAIPQIEVVNAH